MEFKEVLHVSEDDVLLVDDPWRNLLDSTGHFPQVGLHRKKRVTIKGEESLHLCSDI